MIYCYYVRYTVVGDNYQGAAGAAEAKQEYPIETMQHVKLAARDILEQIKKDNPKLNFISNLRILVDNWILMRTEEGHLNTLATPPRKP